MVNIAAIRYNHQVSCCNKIEHKRRNIIEYKPIPFIGGPKHGELWEPASSAARNMFVKLNYPNGDTYLRKAVKTANGKMIELWIFADLQEVVDDLAKLLGFTESARQ